MICGGIFVLSYKTVIRPKEYVILPCVIKLGLIYVKNGIIVFTQNRYVVTLRNYVIERSITVRYLHTDKTKSASFGFRVQWIVGVVIKDIKILYS